MALTDEQAMKVYIWGGDACGKTSLLRRFVFGTFDRCEPTSVLLNCEKAQIRIGGKILSFELWDFPGKKRYITFPRSRPDCCLLLLDVTRRDSFESMKHWHSWIMKEVSKYNWTMPFVLVGTKEDLRAEVGWSEAYTWARSHDMPLMLCSAKTGTGVEQVFHEAMELGCRYRI